MKGVVAVILLLPAIASADATVMTGAPGAGQPVAQPFVPATPPAPKRSPIEARQDMAASNRGLAAPTALTVPAGQVELTVQSVFPVAALGGLNAGLTSTTEVWIEGAGTLIDDSGGEYGAGIKQSLLRTRNLALAVTGSMRKFVGSGSERLMAIGAVGTLCVDDSCTFELSGSFSRVWSRFESDFETSDRGENLVTVSVSVGNASTRFLAEALEVEGEGVGFLGLRFGNRTWAVDLGLVRPLAGPFVGGETDIPALPWIAVSARL